MTFDPHNPLSNGPVVYQSVLDLCFMIYQTPEAVEWLKASGLEYTMLEEYGLIYNLTSVEFIHKKDAALFKMMFV